MFLVWNCHSSQQVSLFDIKKKTERVSGMIEKKKMTIERKQVIAEVKKQLWLAVPMSCIGLLQYSLQTISVMFVGHVGTLPLSGASMATSFASLTGFNLLVNIYTFSI